jgi:hypothetical protein
MSLSACVPAAALVASLAGSAAAQIVPFTAEWRNPATGAQAVALFDLDVGAVNALYNPGAYNFGPFAGSPFSNFTITVSGAAAGNGTWVQADFSDVLLSTSLPLNPLTEWVGQPQDPDPWGTIPASGAHDFNIFAAPLTNAPSGVQEYQLGLLEGSGETLSLTSFRPVPTPGAALVLAMGGALAARRRR